MRKFKFEGEELIIETNRYRDNESLAVSLILPSGELFARLSVNIPESATLPADYFFAKTWSENEEVAAAALASGYFEDTGKRVPAGFCVAQLWRLVGGE